MRPGTPVFIGSRLREAREARGLTAVSLSELIGVSRQAISQYEHGSVTPHPEVMRKIAAALNLPETFFIRPVTGSSPTGIFFRSFSAATKMARTRGQRRLEWLREIVDYLQEFVELPPVNYPVLDLPSNPLAITNADIETVAQEVRRFWGLGDGVISNVVRLLERSGTIVARDTTGTEAIDAFSFWEDGDRPFVILGNDKQAAARSRFDAAHELGHLLLHQKIDKRSLFRPAEFKVLEEQANAFAAAFLLPEKSFAKDCVFLTLDSLRILKSKWRVSIGMMIMRAREIGLCTEEQAQALWRSYSRRGWKKQEPLDDELPLEEPHLLRISFELLINEGGQTPADILEALPFSPKDIEELAGLKGGFLDDQPLKVNLSKESQERENHKVITFPTVGRPKSNKLK